MPSHHSFDVEMAEEYGVDEAILIYSFQWWISKNRAEKRHLHRRRTWTWNSYEGLTQIFPYWNAAQVRRIVNSLLDEKKGHEFWPCA